MDIILSFNNFVIYIVTFLKLANVINCAICLKNISEKKEKEESKDHFLVIGNMLLLFVVIEE